MIQKSPDKNRFNSIALVTLLFLALSGWTRSVQGQEAAAKIPSPAEVRLQVVPGHPWRPPFGVDRVGRSTDVIVSIHSKELPAGQFYLVGYRQGQEVSRQAMHLTDKTPFTGRETMAENADQLEIYFVGSKGNPVSLARQAIELPSFEAEAIATPDRIINPVDLGAVLVPADWLMLAGGQKAYVTLAALSRTKDFSAARVMAWYRSDPQKKVNTAMPLSKGSKVQKDLALTACSKTLEEDILHVTIEGVDGKEIWHKQIRVMIAPEQPKWPTFGAVSTKLRYDAPISLLDRETDEFSSMPYSKGWEPHLNDVVVSLPNGSHFVFWRGASYVPFWAGQHNTGISYEWAETGPLPDGFVDSVEPLMDKELRYGRVEIIESTASRIHVRWSYQSCDFNYKVWGDSAEEDFYFYPDGFGTRVLNLKSALNSDYELSEFIILTPKAAFPLNVLPQNLVDVIFMDGQKREFSFPFLESEQAKIRKSRDMSAVYRVRLHKDETATAIYFNPLDKKLPRVFFAPFYDRGYMVTPAYWGSHWPLGRGKTTGGSIDDRIYLSPSHNSIMSWARDRPKPIRSDTLETKDTLGKLKKMKVQTWTWLIGMTDAEDDVLLQAAQSFAQPPSLELTGARLDSEPYASERRALRLVIENKNVAITIKPAVWCVNPVFELRSAPKKLLKVKLGDQTLTRNQYAWDGQTLWLNAKINQPKILELGFGE